MSNGKLWTVEEEKLLLKLKEDNLTYKEMTEHFEGRNVHQIRTKYYRILNNQKRYGIKQDHLPKAPPKKWTKEEIEVLKNNYDEAWDNLYELLPNRTKSSIKHKLSELKFKRAKRAVTDEQREFIINNYKDMSARDMADRLGIKIKAVHNELNKIGIKNIKYKWVATSLEPVPNEIFSIKMSYKKVIDKE